MTRWLTLGPQPCPDPGALASELGVSAQALSGLLDALQAPVDEAAIEPDLRALCEVLLRQQVIRRLLPLEGTTHLEGDERFVGLARRRLAGRFVHEQAPGRVLFLGALGSPDWWARLRAAESGPAAVTVSTEADTAWVGPLLGASSPCPVCLLHRRLAAGGARPHPPLPDALRELALELLANALLFPGISTSSVIQVFPYTPLSQPLLASNQCRRCHPEDASTLEAQAQRATQHLQRALARAPVTEPPDSIEDVLTNPVTGPAHLFEDPRPGGVLGGALRVGGVRTLAWDLDRQVVVHHPNAAFGAGLDELQRRRVLRSELLERLALISQRPDLRASESSSVEPWLDWERALPGSGPLPERLDVSWMVELPSLRARLVPFEALVAGRPPRAGAARLNDEPFFTGGACHRSARLAFEHALFEVVERDAFMVAWYLRLPLPRVRPSLSQEAARLEQALIGRGVSLRHLQLSVEAEIPVVLTVAEATRPLGRWAVGGVVLSACAAATLERAAERGLVEIAGQFDAIAFAAAEQRQRDAAWSPLLEELLSARGAGLVAPLDGGDRVAVVEASPVGAPVLEALIGRLASAGTAPLLRLHETSETTLTGLSAVQVLVPSFLKPAASREAMRFPMDRLGRIAQRWSVPLELNPAQHPQA